MGGVSPSLKVGGSSKIPEVLGVVSNFMSVNM